MIPNPRMLFPGMGGSPLSGMGLSDFLSDQLLQASAEEKKRRQRESSSSVGALYGPSALGDAASQLFPAGLKAGFATGGS